MVVVDPKIEASSSRIRIRPLATTDADGVHSIRSAPVALKYSTKLPSTSVEQTKIWIQDCLDRPNCWNFVVELLKPPESAQTEYIPKIIGLVGAIRVPEVGFALNPDYWGKGYASEALQMFMRIWWEHYSGDKTYDYAEAFVDVEHGPSRRVLERAGFKVAEMKKVDFSLPPWNAPHQGIKDICVYRISRPGTSSDRAASGTAEAALA